MKVYHVTDSADAIARGGFRDGEGSYGFVNFRLTGVFVSDEPLSVNEGAIGEQVLEVTLADDETALIDYEILEDAKPYREWCVPAELLNRGRVRLLDQEEVDALLYPE